MKIKLICVGKIKERFYTDAINEYIKRISKFATVEITELSDEKTLDNPSNNEINMILNKEGARILNSIKPNEYVISLCIEGKRFSSMDFAHEIQNIMNSGNGCIDFIIGGSLGLSDDVKKRSNLKLSFSDFTFPHQLMRVIFLEQIYRTYKILNNEPYHK